jgi:F0F1-type ATP synthase membrane subunit c/vacuolar-type H+-ATPase subunit K
MRTPLFLLVGFLLLAACMLLGKLFSSNYSGATYAATLIFVALWLGISGANLWVGVARAGYSLNEEFPIFLLIFGLPTIVAIFLKWRIL